MKINEKRTECEHGAQKKIYKKCSYRVLARAGIITAYSPSFEKHVSNCKYLFSTVFFGDVVFVGCRYCRLY